MRSLAILGMDARQAVRSLSARPGFVVAVAVMLGLSIGITSTMFAIVDSLLLRPVPFRGAQDLAFVFMGNANGGRTTVAPSVLRAWRDSRIFADVEAATAETSLIAVGDSVLMRGSALVTVGVFELLGGVRPVIGRLFEPGEGRAGSDDRVLLSERLWRSVYGADTSLLNQRIVVDGDSLIVIGVVPSQFQFPDSRTMMWRPIDFDVLPRKRETERPTAYVRFPHDVPREEVARVATEVAHNADGSTAQLNLKVRPLVGLPINDYSQRAVRLLAGAVLLVFIVLCLNVCSLLLSRATESRPQLALRIALGASRGALIRAAMVEAAILGACGVIVGVGVAWTLIAVANVYLPESLQLQTLNPLDFDFRGLIATMTASVCATVASALLPIWNVTRLNDGRCLRAVALRSSDSRQSRGVARGLLIGEVALSCTLLSGATLLVRSFLNLAGVERGVETGRILTATMTLPPNAFADARSRAAIALTVEQRIRELRDIHQVVWSVGLPPSGGGFMTYEWLPEGATGIAMTVNTYSVSPEFFDLYGIRIIRGRGFEQSDTPQQVIVGERFADALWPGQEAVGRTFTYRSQPVGAEPAPTYRIIGVAREQVLPTLDSRLDRPELYLPFNNISSYAMLSMGCAVTCPDVATLRRVLMSSHPAIRVHEVRTLESAFAEHLAGPRATAALAIVFACLAIVAVAGGLFSVLSYFVGRRRREFGIRSAVGASPGNLGQTVLYEAMIVTVIGISIGSVGAVALGRALSSVQFGVSMTDLVSWLLVTTTLAMTSLAASWCPVRAAVHTDPVILLRDE